MLTIRKFIATSPPCRHKSWLQVRASHQEPAMITIVKSLVGGLQKPKYEVDQEVEHPGNCEVRVYKPSKWVCTTVKSISHKQATEKAFHMLFNYIQGENDAKIKVEMTAPVLTKVVPGAGPNCESSFTTAFFIPEEHEASPPVPTNPEIFIEEKPEQAYYVRNFSGYANDEKWITEGLQLTEAIGDETKYETGHFFTAGYDPPFKLIGRSNEVWFPQAGN